MDSVELPENSEMWLVSNPKKPKVKRTMSFNGFCWNVFFISMMLVIIALSTSGTT